MRNICYITNKQTKNIVRTNKIPCSGYRNKLAPSTETLSFISRLQHFCYLRQRCSFYLYEFTWKHNYIYDNISFVTAELNKNRIKATFYGTSVHTITELQCNARIIIFSFCSAITANSVNIAGLIYSVVLFYNVLNSTHYKTVYCSL